MKIKVFIEYKLNQDIDQGFSSHAPKLRDKWKELGAEDVHIYEGTDQPNLIVEEFFVDSEEAYHRLKDLRLAETDPFWKDLHGYIAGGKDKVHIWAFREL